MNELGRDYKLRGNALMGNGQYKEAQVQFLKALIEEENADLYADLGNAYASNGDYKEAIDAFSKALLLDPKNGEIYFDIGSVYLLQERLKKCIEFYNKAEDAGFKNVRLFINLAAIYSALGDKQMELRNYTKAIDINPLIGDLYVKKALVLMDLGRPEVAIETIEDLRKLFPDAFEGYDLAARAYLYMGDKEKAMDILEAGINKFPNDINLKLSKIGLYTQFNEPDKAEELLNKLKENSNAELYKRDILLNEVTITALRNDPATMKEKLMKVIAMEKEKCDEQARFMLMMTANLLKDYTLAYEQADALDKQDSNSTFSISGLYYKGEFLEKIGKTEEANTQFRKATKKLRKLSMSNRTFYEVYIYRAMAHQHLKEYDKAIEMAEFITDLQPERADGYMILADIYKDMGDTEKSEAQFAIAQKKNPELKRR